MLKAKSSIITILDICTTKVVCIIARCVSNDKFEIIGSGYTKSEGIKAGIISDIALAQQSILAAIVEAEKIAGTKVTQLYVTVPSNSLLSQRFSTEIIVTGHDITQKDLNKLSLEAIRICQKQQLDVLHTFIYDYVLDGNYGIRNPIGLCGNKLTCNLHILCAPINSLLNLQNCITKIGLHVEKHISSTYATGLACLSKDETETGVTLIDFGAGMTSFAVFENEQLIYTDSISIGGDYITSDIAKMLCLSMKEAERLKNLYGGVLSTDLDMNEAILNVKDNNEEDITRSRLVDIIQARIEEILQIIKEKITNEGLSITNKIVITGGVARTLRLKELLAIRFNTKVAIGYPKNISLMNIQKNNLELTSALGVLTYIQNNMIQLHIDEEQNDTGIKNILSWIKSTFF